mgnify:CR=1 FL=1
MESLLKGVNLILEQVQFYVMESTPSVSINKWVFPENACISESSVKDFTGECASQRHFYQRVLSGRLLKEEITNVKSRPFFEEGVSQFRSPGNFFLDNTQSKN